MKSQLELQDYRNAILLDEPFICPGPPLAAAEREHIVDQVLEFLCAEVREPCLTNSSCSYSDKRKAVRGLLTQRSPGNFPEDLLDKLDRLMAGEARERKIHDPLAGMSREADRILLWQGDITLLKVGAIVNAANSGLLGCFQPFHKCIDNIIHDKAGPRLRQDCDRIMDLQGHRETTGIAKITRGYHLPADYVLHTVGPIINRGSPSPEDRELLASCYRSCLDLAAEFASIRSVAFCCISTGVFGYPKDEAAQVAINTVRGWLEKNAGRMDAVVFNVFEDNDRMIYENRLEKDRLTI